MPELPEIHRFASLINSLQGLRFNKVEFFAVHAKRPEFAIPGFSARIKADVKGTIETTPMFYYYYYCIII
jgi:hypothetical protein